MAFGVGSQWLFNFIWSFATPYIMAGIGWGTFLLFGLLDILILAFTYFCLKETAGKTLEEINEMFEGVDLDAERGWKDGDVLEEGSETPRSNGQERDSDGSGSMETRKLVANGKNGTTHVEGSTVERT